MSSPRKDVDFSKATRLVTKTFDGLERHRERRPHRHRILGGVRRRWHGRQSRRGKQASEINARVTGWAYKLPDYKGAQFMTPLESLLKPKAGKPAAAP